MTLARTEPGHLGVVGRIGRCGRRATGQMKPTDKPVAIDQQLMLADETNRAFSLDTGIVKAFHRMLMTAVRSG